MTAIESLVREESFERFSDRDFRLVFSAFFSLVACWPLVLGGSLRLRALVLGKADMVAEDIKQLEACCKNEAEVKQLLEQLTSANK